MNFRLDPTLRSFAAWSLLALVYDDFNNQFSVVKGAGNVGF